MKIGLFVLIALVAIFTQVLAKDFYMLSVFVIGINAGKAIEEDNSPKIKEVKNGLVRLRVIVFKNTKNVKKSSPGIDDLEWEISFATDFDIPFENLNKNFLKTFFKDLLLKAKFITNDVSSPGEYFKEIRGSSITLKIFGQKIEAVDTHCGSLITNVNLLDEVKFSVLFDRDLQIHLTKEGKLPEKSLFSYRITENYPYDEDTEENEEGDEKKDNKGKKDKDGSDDDDKTKDNKEKEEKEKKEDKKEKTTKKKCISLKDTYKFEMVSSKLSKGDEKFKIVSALKEKNKTLKDFAPFKIKAKEIYLNLILVLNGIPIKRFFSNPSSSITFGHTFPFIVEAKDLGINRNTHPNPFSGETPAWDLLINNGSKIHSNPCDNKNLITKWKDFNEVISTTLHFDCAATQLI